LGGDHQNFFDAAAKKMPVFEDSKGKEAEIVISSDDEHAIEHDTSPVILRVFLSPSSPAALAC
jgi:hypothetical protein